MRRSTSHTAMMGAVFFALAGCQLLTNTYNVDSDAGSGSALGPNCTAVAFCCASLGGTDATTCYTLAGLANEAACSDFLQMAACLAIALPDSGVVPDSGIAKRDGATGMDGSLPHTDALHREDAFTEDGSTSDPLNGTSWTLTNVACDGESLGVNGTTTLSFSGTDVQDVETLSDGCVITTNVNPATITSSAITAPFTSIICGSSCTADDDCTGGTGAAVDDSYTRSGGTLTTETIDNTDCSSGTVTFTWTQD